MTEYKSMKAYLKDLRLSLKGADPALLADALDDAEEHLNEMTNDLVRGGGCSGKKEAFRKAVKQYGSPRFIAKEYIKLDENLKRRRESKREKRDNRSVLRRTLGVYAEGRTYKNMLYLFLMFPLGIIYFVYIVVGFSLSLGLLITVIGVPLLVLFLLSLTGIAWFQGRLTEGLLGIRMPRKRRKFRAKGKMWKRLKIALKNPRRYLTVLYLFLLFPLGIIYFVVMITLVATSGALILAPIWFVAGTSSDIPFGIPGPLWFQFVTLGFGLILLTWSMHLVNILARLHGKMSKKLLLTR